MAIAGAGPDRQDARCAPPQRRGHRVGAGLRRAEIRHAGGTEPRQGFRRVRHEECGDRLGRFRALEDRLHRALGQETRRGADHGDDEIEFRRVGKHLERRLHGRILRAGNREIDQPCRRDIDAGRRAHARRRMRARRLNGNASHGQRIDHHGGAAGGGRHHGDGRHAIAAFDPRHPGQQG
jgi:hypothetical protein